MMIKLFYFLIHISTVFANLHDLFLKAGQPGDDLFFKADQPGDNPFLKVDQPGKFYYVLDNHMWFNFGNLLWTLATHTAESQIAIDMFYQNVVTGVKYSAEDMHNIIGHGASIEWNGTKTTDIGEIFFILKNMIK